MHQPLRAVFYGVCCPDVEESGHWYYLFGRDDAVTQAMAWRDAEWFASALAFNICIPALLQVSALVWPRREADPVPEALLLSHTEWLTVYQAAAGSVGLKSRMPGDGVSFPRPAQVEALFGVGALVAGMQLGFRPLYVRWAVLPVSLADVLRRMQPFEPEDPPQIITACQDSWLALDVDQAKTLSCWQRERGLPGKGCHTAN